MENFKKKNVLPIRKINKINFELVYQQVDFFNYYTDSVVSTFYIFLAKW
jgi:hypothetical protein